ncbi:MAG: alanine racemase [Spirochaetaceae bacterium]|nr:alanine racemase [Spirochaetaceae bacterium]
MPAPRILPATRLEVDLDALSHNVALVRGLLAAGASGGQTPALAAVIKADAYGLGALPVARELVRSGVDLLAVARLGEALELVRGFAAADRGAADRGAAAAPTPILVMGHTPDEELEAAVAAGVRVTIFDERQAAELSRAALALGKPARAHVKVDTGMNRLGLKPDADTTELLARMAGKPGLELEGIFTHLALCDAESDRRQFELFTRVVAEAEGRGLRFAYKHVCDSIGLCRYPAWRLDLVRAGAILFGAKPGNAPLAADLDLRAPFAFKTRVSRLRPVAEGEGVGYDYTWRAPPGGARIATLPVGYVDGYRRCLSNKAEVLVRGRRARVVGLVCMDQLVVDVTNIPGAAEGDEVLLFGRSGEGELGLLEVAGWAGTNRNEILASIGRRVPRVYFRGGEPVETVDYLDPHPSQGARP